MEAPNRPKRARAEMSYREPTESDIFSRNGRDPFAPDGAARRPQRDKTNLVPLDSVACENRAVTGAPGFTYSIGGAEIGGAECERVLKEVEIDENAIKLRQQFSDGRRAILMKNGVIVAAAVAETHVSPSNVHPPIFEIPILASIRTGRQQGYGSVR